MSNKDKSQDDIEEKQAAIVQVTVDEIKALLVKKYSSVSDEFIDAALTFYCVHDAIHYIEIEQAETER